MREVRCQGPTNRRAAELERTTDAVEPDREGLPLMARWRVEIIVGRRRVERFGTVEAPNQREAYRLTNVYLTISACCGVAGAPCKRSTLSASASKSLSS